MVKVTKRLLNSQEAAEVLGVTAPTVARWTRYNRIQAVKVGRWNRYTPESLTLLVQELYPTKEANQRLKKMNQILTDRTKDEIVARTKA